MGLRLINGGGVLCKGEGIKGLRGEGIMWVGESGLGRLVVNKKGLECSRGCR